MSRKNLGLLMLLGCVGACRSDDVTVAGTENPLGELVECDEVIEGVVGANRYGDIWRRRKVAYVPVEDPLSVRITRCDYYYFSNGEHAMGGSLVECYSNDGDNLVPDGRPVTFTSDLEVVVECEVEESDPREDGISIERWGSERTYLRSKPLQPRSGTENILGSPVECNDTILEELGGSNATKKARQVAYVPVTDPTSVTITRCGWYRDSDGEKTLWSPNCVAETEVEFTPDSHVVVECGVEITYPPGHVDFIGYETVYLREDSRPSAPPAETRFGAPVECDEVIEWETDWGSHRYLAAYVPVTDPTSVTITRCGKYEIDHDESTYDDACVSSNALELTPDLEVFVSCEMQSDRGTTGYSRIYVLEN